MIVMMMPLVLIGLIASPALAGNTVTLNQQYFAGDGWALNNPSFEDSYDYWTVESGSASSTTIHQDETRGVKLTHGSGSAIIRQTIPSQAEQVLEGRNVKFSFWFTSSTVPTEQARAWIGFKRSGGWYWYTSGLISGYVYTTNYVWACCSVEHYIEPDFGPYLTTDVAVKIEVSGVAGVAYVDNAKIIISESQTSSYSSPNGEASLIVDVTKIEDSDVLSKRVVTFAVAVAGEAVAPWQIRGVQLRMEMFPQTGWWIWKKTTQDGSINIARVGQANDKDMSVNPEYEGQLNEFGLKAAGWAADKILSSLPLTGPLGAVAGAILKKGTSILFDYFEEQSTSFDTVATGGKDYSTQIHWPLQYAGMVGFATCVNTGLWLYEPGHSDYYIKIDAEIEWFDGTYRKFTTLTSYLRA